MKTKTVFSEFQLYVDDEVKFFEYCLESGQYFVRPLEPYLKNECFEVYRKENMQHIFFAVVQVGKYTRRLIPELIDVVETHRQYQLLEDVLIFSEKINRLQGNVWQWRVWAIDAFAELKDITNSLVNPKKMFIKNVERSGDFLKIRVCSNDDISKYLYFEQIHSEFQPIDEEWFLDTEESFRCQKQEILNENWQRLENEMF